MDASRFAIQPDMIIIITFKYDTYLHRGGQTLPVAAILQNNGFNIHNLAPRSGTSKFEPFDLYSQVELI